MHEAVATIASFSLLHVHANRMKPYYDPDSRPQIPPSIEMPDEPPIPENELPDNVLDDNTPVHQPSIDQSVPADTSVVAEDSEMYNIEHIIKERKRKKQFLVQCEGYGPEHNSWVEEAEIIHLEQNND